jgi:glyoxylase-like metal-dependent hydrolase (beta-lactamase superfamily II)
MDGRTHGLVRRGELSCHCLLLETAVGLVLVDTGFGLRDVRDPQSRLSRFFLGLVSPDFREELTAVRQIARLQLDPRDVRHIVLTHLDFDHAGGLDDFPAATVHLLASERDAAVAQRTWLDRQRYRPQQWSTRQQ